MVLGALQCEGKFTAEDPVPFPNLTKKPCPSASIRQSQCLKENTLEQKCGVMGGEDGGSDPGEGWHPRGVLG